MAKDRLMKDTSLDAWDDILCDGTLGGMMLKALSLISDNKDKTVRELLSIGVNMEIYLREDRNLIAPRITGLADEALIIRPFTRPCTITGKTVLVHRLAPKEWVEHRRYLLQQHYKGPCVMHRLEIESNSKKGAFHTTIWWSDGSVSCTCNELYHRPAHHRCHHVKGLILAVENKEMDDAPIDMEAETRAINKLR